MQPASPGSLTQLDGGPDSHALCERLLTEQPVAVSLDGELPSLRWGTPDAITVERNESSCRLCGESAVTRISHHPEMTIGRCASCGCGQVTALDSRQGGEAADDYSERYGSELREDKARACWELFCRCTEGLEAVDSVLDVGCGGGAFLDLARDAGLKTAGLELAPEAAVTSLRKGHEIYCRSAESEVFPPGRTFDAVVLWDVLEHLERPGLALENAGRVLAPGGQLLILTPMMGSVFDRLGLALDRWSGGRVRQLLRMCWTRDHLCRFDRAGTVRVLRGFGYRSAEARAVSLLSLRKDRYAGGEVMRSWTGRPFLDRWISRLGVNAVRLFRIHNKVLVHAIKAEA